MKIPFEKFSLQVDATNFNPSKIAILFIHGFTGSSEDWKEITKEIDPSFSIVTIDLVGHGKSGSPKEFDFYEIDSIVRQIEKVLDELNIEKIILAGYSMGGRIALSFTISKSRRVAGLILESTTAGIENEQERNQRFRSDKKLAENITTEGIENFVEYWMELPIFSSQKNLPEEKLVEIKNRKLKNDQIGLSNSLLGFSTGKMRPMWNELEKVNLPVLSISGKLDKKYCELNTKMKKLMPNSIHHIVDGAGHNIHLEKPSEFVILVNHFLRTNFT